MERHFPGDYRVIAPTARRGARRAHDDARSRYGSSSSPRRSAPRCAPSCGRCGACGTGVDWRGDGSRRAMGSLEPGVAASPTCARASRFLDDADSARAALLERADVVVLASGGHAAGARAGARGDRRARRAAGVAPGASYEEVLADGDRGLLFEPGRRRHAGRAARAPGAAIEPLRERWSPPPSDFRAALTAQRVVDQLEEVYEAVAARRHERRPHAARRGRAAPPARALIDVDLHMHTDHSPRLRDAGRGAARDGAGTRASARSRSPTTTRSPARSRRCAKAEGIKVIVGEEVKTAEPGRGDRPVHRARRSRAG